MGESYPGPGPLTLGGGALLLPTYILLTAVSIIMIIKKEREVVTGQVQSGFGSVIHFLTTLKRAEIGSTLVLLRLRVAARWLLVRSRRLLVSPGRLLGIPHLLVGRLSLLLHRLFSDALMFEHLRRVRVHILHLLSVVVMTRWCLHLL